MHKLTVYIPETHVEQVKEAIFAAGAGRYAAYDRCCWQVLGQGQFRPLEGSSPAIGERGVVVSVPEYRVEAICADADIPAVIAAIRAAHPYEEPAFVFTPVRMQ
ncbi:MAG: NGG1p interacting factor NIF3 [Kiritimatiellaeota bacterium]|nr:NGG1p interacting factor NIF3 [Kiritimatiellota bacterium]